MLESQGTDACFEEVLEVCTMGSAGGTEPQHGPLHGEAPWA